MPKINVKGHKAFGKVHGRGQTHIHPDVSQGAMERQLFANEKGPRMLPRAQRFKVWFALTAIGGWFVGCFALVAFRLRSDDLELMEREVYEDLKVKKEVERFQERQKRHDILHAPAVDKVPSNKIELSEAHKAH